MKAASTIGRADVNAVCSGPQGDLWELIMGQQILIGGLTSSLELAERAGIGAGQTGVDATPTVIARGQQRCPEEGLAERILGFDTDLMQALASEMNFSCELAHAGKVAQGRFVARRT